MAYNGTCNPTIDDNDQTLKCLETKHFIWERLLGPLLIGWLFATLLTGVMLAQLYNYWPFFKTDRRHVKYSVIFVVCANLASTGIEWHTTYANMIQLIPFGLYNPFVAYSNTDSVAVLLLPTLVAFVVQCHFAVSAYQLTKSKLFAGVVFGWMFCGLFGGITTGATSIWLHAKPGDNQLNFTTSVTYIWLGCSAISDCLITGTLVVSLWRRRTIAPTNRMRNLVLAVVRLSISTCFCTSANALAVIIAHTTKRFTGDVHQLSQAYGGLAIILPRTYACTFLFVLNARPKLEAYINSGSLTLGLLSPGSTEPTNNNGVETHVLKPSSLYYTQPSQEKSPPSFNKSTEYPRLGFLDEINSPSAPSEGLEMPPLGRAHAV